jgi:predicted amidophosphoribosyltransferase
MIIDKPINTELVFRTKHTQSQTSKKRFERWENMENVFSLSEEAPMLSNTTILLIDDVITTGATLEACAETLLAIPGISIYVASIAYA